MEKDGTRLNVAVCGGGIAGQALALCLSRRGHRVVVIERFPALRATGAQVDLRGQGIDAVRRIGLLDAVKAIRVDEPGVAFVNRQGKRVASVMANTSGKGRQTMTSEYELMRGDLVRLLHEQAHGGVTYRFGLTVDGFEQDDERVIAHLSDGSHEEFDLLVGADGQGSPLRRAIEPAGAPDPYWPVGIHMAYWFIPRTADDSNIRDSYVATGGRLIMRRSHNATTTQVYFALWETSPEASAIHREPVERQKEFWAERFRDAGWQANRFISAMADAEFFYSQEVVQVRTDTWSKGRVVLLGDAAHCSSPYSGMGTSAALVGAYVLAGELVRNADDLPLALTRYHDVMRPFVREIQSEVNPKVLRVGFPKSRFGVNALLTLGMIGSALHLPELAARFAREDRGGSWPLPDYPELAPSLPSRAPSVTTS